MKTFREQIAADNTAAFINSLEFADKHNLNGAAPSCKTFLLQRGYLRGLDPVKLMQGSMVVGFR